jgi:hypothetical protein
LSPFNFKYSPLLSYVYAISGHKDLKLQAPESSICVNGAIGLGKKKKEKREGRRRRLQRGLTDLTWHDPIEPPI